MGGLFSHLHELLGRTHRRLEESQADLLERTSRMAQVGGWSYDPATGQGSWTAESARIHGLSPGTPINVTAGLGYYREDFRPLVEQVVTEASRNGTPFDLEAVIVDARGEAKWVRTQGAGVVRHGQVVEVHGAMQDITERKLAELAVRQLNADLERRVEERTRELQAANEDLASFSYAVSHDLRAPLRAMTGFSRALLEDYGPVLAGDGQMFLAQIVEGSDHMGRLIDGLLLLSRCTRGELQRDRVDLSALAGRIRGDLEREEPERVVQWDLQPGLAVLGDERMLEVVLRNLLGNAWKYTSRTARPRIALTGGRDGGTASFRVQDNGAGFDEAFAGKLFQPFQRLHRQDEFPGLGIGLATAQRILQRHGGTLAAASTPGQGAAFTLTLPDLPPEALP